MKNFNAPYLAKSIHDFWKRWHISLTSWFRDYLYIPLGGNRVSKPRYYFNIMIVFILSGLWHGASFIWGLLHGIYQLIGTITQKLRNRLKDRLNIHDESIGYTIFRRLLVFTLVCFAWIFFRANNISDAFHAVEKISIIKPADLFQFVFNEGIYKLGINNIELIIVFVFILIIYFVDFSSQKNNLLKILNSEPLPIRWFIYLAIIFSIIIFGAYGNNILSEFIYFQF
jgi:hypothetical protein